MSINKKERHRDPILKYEKLMFQKEKLLFAVEILGQFFASPKQRKSMQLQERKEEANKGRTKGRRQGRAYQADER